MPHGSSKAELKIMVQTFFLEPNSSKSNFIEQQLMLLSWSTSLATGQLKVKVLAWLLARVGNTL